VTDLHVYEKPHISATQLMMAGKCLEQYRRRYVLGERIPPGIAAIIGRGMHRGAETNFKQKIESFRDLPPADIVDAAVAAFEEETDGGEYQLSDDEAIRGARVVVAEAKDTTAKLAKCHAQQQAPDYQPVAVEHTSRILFPQATHDLLAITDLRDDQDRVVDFKTAARKPPAKDVDESVQLTIYAAAFQVENGRPPAEVRLDTVTKTKTPARHVLTSTRDEHDYRALLARANAMLGTVETLTNDGRDCWPAAAVGQWWCSSRWCGYWRTCPHVNSERVAAAK